MPASQAFRIMLEGQGVEPGILAGEASIRGQEGVTWKA
jgi:hypothetical protein